MGRGAIQQPALLLLLLCSLRTACAGPAGSSLSSLSAGCNACERRTRTRRLPRAAAATPSHKRRLHQLLQPAEEEGVQRLVLALQQWLHGTAVTLGQGARLSLLQLRGQGGSEHLQAERGRSP